MRRTASDLRFRTSEAVRLAEAEGFEPGSCLRRPGPWHQIVQESKALSEATDKLQDSRGERVSSDLRFLTRTVGSTRVLESRVPGHGKRPGR
jgi:hypothetical protein